MITIWRWSLDRGVQPPKPLGRLDLEVLGRMRSPVPWRALERAAELRAAARRVRRVLARPAPMPPAPPVRLRLLRRGAAC